MNSIALDILHTRRPVLNYVSPAICDAIFSSSSFPTLVLEAIPKKPGITGARAFYAEGGFRLQWNVYPGAICYTVYKVNDATDPFGEYSIIAECISDPQYDPALWELPFNPDDPACYLVSVLTAEGEIFADTNPECFTWSEVEGAPPPDPGGSGCLITSGALPEGTFGEEFSYQILATTSGGEQLWEVISGSLPEGISLDPVTGLISGTPTEDGDFTFQVRLTAGADVCEGNFTWTVVGFCPDWNTTEWTQQSSLISGGTSNVITAEGAVLEMDANCPASEAVCGNPETTDVVRAAGRTYEGVVANHVGPATTCKMKVTVSGSALFTDSNGTNSASSSSDASVQVYLASGPILYDLDIFNGEGAGVFIVDLPFPEVEVPTNVIISVSVGAQNSASADLSCAYGNISAPEATSYIKVELGVAE
jgi:hypothetical protein